MKTLMRKLIDTLADAALLEEGLEPGMVRQMVCGPERETMEENFAEIAFAEESDYAEIHEAILREHRAHCATA